MLDQIHQLSLDILAQVGVRIDAPAVAQALANRGITIKGSQAVFTPDQIDAALATVPEQFDLQGRDPAKQIRVGDTTTHYMAAFGAPFILDKGERREAVLTDYIRFAKWVHMVDQMPINGGLLVQPSDIPADRYHLILLYAALLFSDKPLMGLSGPADQQEEILGLLKIVYGDDALEKGPVMITLGNTTSPLILDKNLLQTLEVSARYHQPIVVSPGPMAGSTGPIDMVADVALANAEILAAVVCAQAVSPGTPVIYGLMAQPADMQSCEIDTGSPGAMAATVLGARLARRYGLPSRGGSTPVAREVSVLSGMESMMKNMAASTGGIHLIIHSAGLLDRFNCVCPEQFLVDVDGFCRIEYFKSLLNRQDAGETHQGWLDEIKAVGPGGNFLMSPSTLAQCRTTPYVPRVKPRVQPGESENQALIREAGEVLDRMLDDYRPPTLEPETHKAMAAYLVECGVPQSIVDDMDREYQCCCSR